MSDLRRGDLIGGKNAVAGTRPKSRWELFVESNRVLNPRRVERAFVFATNPRLGSALSSLGDCLPWVDAGRLSSPGQIYRPLSEGGKPSVLLVDDGSIVMLDRERFRKANPDAGIVLVSALEYIGCAPPHAGEARYPFLKKADFVFYAPSGALQGEVSSVVSSAIRSAEDRLNIEEGFHKKRFIFLAVDDEPRWYSQFLPVLYRMIGRRADVMVARTYEDAAGVFTSHGDDIVCLIADVNFTRKGASGAETMGPNGITLAKMTRENFPRIPIIIASKAEIPEDLREMAFLMPKGDMGANRELERYVRDFTGLGDFLFYEGKKEISRATNLQELRESVLTMPIGVLEQYAQKDFFSTWLYMHAFPSLGDYLRPRQDRGETLRKVLAEAMEVRLAEVRGEPLIFLDESGSAVSQASTLAELAAVVMSLDLQTLEFYSDHDGFSTWLMRKGQSRLADELRPVHGKGEELRSRLIGIIGNYSD